MQTGELLCLFFIPPPFPSLITEFYWEIMHLPSQGTLPRCVFINTSHSRLHLHISQAGDRVWDIIDENFIFHDAFLKTPCQPSLWPSIPCSASRCCSLIKLFARADTSALNSVFQDLVHTTKRIMPPCLSVM